MPSPGVGVPGGVVDGAGAAAPFFVVGVAVVVVVPGKMPRKAVVGGAVVGGAVVGVVVLGPEVD